MPYYAYQQNAKTSMYQQNAKNTYAKYVSIKLLHNCYAMQSIAILCHIIAYQQILWNIVAILWHTMHINKMLETHMPSMY
jgi:hypothetical protein